MSTIKETSVKRKIIWNIDNFNKEAFENFKGDVKSENFAILVGTTLTKWNISLRPRSKNANSFCVFFLNKAQVDSNDYFFKLNVLVHGEKRNNFTLEKKPDHTSFNWNFTRFIKIEDIFNEQKKFIVDNRMTIVVDLELYKVEEKNEEKFTEFFLSDRFSDFTFISLDGIKIPVHRCILASRSKVLNRMLDTEMMECKNNQIKIDLNGDTLTEMLRFIYIGKVENLDVQATSLLNVAEKYDLPKLKSCCVSQLINGLSKRNVLDMLILGDRCNEEMLIEKCIEFIKMNFIELQKTESWKGLRQELLLKIINWHNCGCMNIIHLNITL